MVPDPKQENILSQRYGLLLGISMVSLLVAPTLLPSPARAEVAAEDDEYDSTGMDIIVTVSRGRGSVVTDLMPEAELSSEDIESLGISSVNDLLVELSAQTRSARGGRPVMLVNGRRISSFAEIRDIPAEAIAGVEVMPEETALRFGYPAEQKVVNIRLKDHVRVASAELTGGVPTEGGRTSFGVKAGLLKVDNGQRLNVTLGYDRSSALRESARGIHQEKGRTPYAIPGNVAALVPGAEIDPALSAIAGQPVTVAGVPAEAVHGSLPLSAFAGGPADTDIGRYRTLLPEEETLNLNTVLSREIFGNVDSTFTADLTYKNQSSLQGLATLDLRLPHDSPFSPFANDVMVHRYAGTLDPLRQRAWSFEADLGASFNGNIDAWMWTVTTNYDIVHSRTRTTRRADTERFADAILGLSPDINPFAAIPPELAGIPLTDSARTTRQSGNLTLLANGSLFSMPAGEAMTSFTLSEEWNGVKSRSLRDDLLTRTKLSRNIVTGQANFDIPLTSRREDVLPAIGDLSVSFNGAFRHYSDFGTMKALTYGVSWLPVSGVDFIFSYTNEDSAPGMQDLGDPAVLTTGVRVFDYVRGETVDISRLSGGNTGLQKERSRILKIGANLAPFPEEQLQLNITYLREKHRNPTASFPAATAAIEAAFPDRFTRDASGRLTMIDARAVNFHNRTQQQLRWGFNFSKQFQPKRIPPPAGSSPDGAPDRAARQGGATGGGAAGRGPRGGGGPGFGPGNALRLRTSLYHTIYLKDHLQLRESGPMLDLLHGDTLGTAGGQPRHALEARIGLFKSGFGGHLSANWQSATDVHGAGTGDNLHFSSLGTFDLRLFANLGQQESLVSAVPFLKNARLTLSVANLFNARMKVRDSLGDTPVRFQPAYMDALGRSIEVSFRKTF